MRIFIVALIFFSVAHAADYDGLVRPLGPDEAAVGPGWTKSNSTMIIEDLAAPRVGPPEVKEVADLLAEAFKKYGIKRGGELTYRRKDILNEITVQVSVFTSDEALQKWVKAKVDAGDWKGFREVVKENWKCLEKADDCRRVMIRDNVVLDGTQVVFGESDTKWKDLIRVQDMISSRVK